MDLPYPPPPRPKRKQLPPEPQKRSRAADLADLPTHLPNHLPNPDPKPVAAPEEQEHVQKVQTNEPIFIEGTNIALQTEEDIANWIAERRKNWPTRKNVELKQQQLKQPQQTTQKQDTKGGRQVCRFYARNQKCKFGAKCRNVHEQPNGQVRVINGLEITVPQRYKREVQTSSLYSNLVQRDVYAENNVILDFLQYLSKNNLIDRDASV